MVLILSGCFVTDANLDAWFGTDGAATPVDLLLVVDNSDGMKDEAEALWSATDGFPDALDAAGLDWTLSITTTTVDYTAGETAGVDPGEAGSLVAATVVPGAGAAEAVKTALVCGAVCWDEGALASDPGFNCETSEPTSVSREYLDCVCGVDDWQNHCGSGQEEPIEASVLAACRAIEDPPEACFSYDSTPTAIDAGDAGSNDGMLREGARWHTLVLTDEGDGSPRLETGDTDVTLYASLLDELSSGATFSALAPDAEFICNGGGAQTWAVARLVDLSAASGGGYWSITDGTDDCGVVDLESVLEDWLASPIASP